MVKRLRHRPFTAVTGVQIPLESLIGLMAGEVSAVSLVSLFRVSLFADVAQLAEQLICNQQVIGSSPIIGLTVLTVFGPLAQLVRATGS